MNELMRLPVQQFAGFRHLGLWAAYAACSPCYGPRLLVTKPLWTSSRFCGSRCDMGSPSPGLDLRAKCTDWQGGGGRRGALGWWGGGSLHRSWCEQGELESVPPERTILGTIGTFVWG
jgi:hypothetical protein